MKNVSGNGEASGGAAALDAELLTKTVSPGVVQVTLNRPERFNALSGALLSLLETEFARLGADPSVRVVILAGAGGAFCAGHDLREMQASSEQSGYEALFTQCSRFMLSLQRLPQPVIARVHGIATAAGCQLVAACDLAVASEDATFATSGIRFGAFCATPAVAVSRNIPVKQALEMLLTGEFIDAHTALQRGLVNRVVPAAGLDAELAALCGSLTDKPAQALAMGKELFYRQLELGVDAAYRAAGQTMAANLAAPCGQEGLAAFTERRAPNWPAI
jgi:enoyl-CoA hydratase/carnithine racemase